MKNWIKKPDNFLTLILLIFYSVGLVGISINPTDFAKLSPFNLLLTSVLLFWLHPQKDILFFTNLLFVFTGAFFLEMIGVNSGSIFGKYSYGNALGYQLNQTPILIGLNWIIVAYSSIQLVQTLALKFNIKLTELLGALLASIFMVILDFFIEPIAPKLDFWSWENSIIPIQNYTAWFFFGFAFCYWLLKGGMLKNNPLAWRVYLVQITFFILLNITLTHVSL
jgi:uncharacterized membrane protein